MGRLATWEVSHTMELEGKARVRAYLPYGGAYVGLDLFNHVPIPSQSRVGNRYQIVINRL